MNNQPDPTHQYGAAITTGQGQSFWTDNIRVGGVHGQRPPIPTCVLPPQSSYHTNIITSNRLPALPEVNVADNTRRASDSVSSMQQQLYAVDQSCCEPGNASQSDLDLSDSAQRKQRRFPSGNSPNGNGKSEEGAREKKKVGRPIAYKGDPENPNLTEPERRRIKRRIANRESARRVRHKKQETIEHLYEKIDDLQSQNADLKSQFLTSNYENEQLTKQLRSITEKYKGLLETSDNMNCELRFLQSSMQTRMTYLDNMFDKQISQLPDEKESAFGSATAQCPTAPGYKPQQLVAMPSQLVFKGSESFQLDLEHLVSLEDQQSMDLMKLLKRDLSIFRSRALSCLVDQPPPKSPRHNCQ